VRQTSSFVIQRLISSSVLRPHLRAWASLERTFTATASSRVSIPRRRRALVARLDIPTSLVAAEQQPRPFGGEGSFNYDHCWVLNRQSDGDKLMLAARLSDPVSGRVLEISMNQPGIQFYNGKYLDGSAIGRTDTPYGPHAGLCLEPQNFPDVATDIAHLVKKYRGSLSGEHGDGRLRGEFIPLMVGDACFAMMKEVKAAFDPQNVFNPGKIIDTPPMDTHLRHMPGAPTPDYATLFDFSDVQGVVCAAEKCNGSGDCRKSQLAGGTMCPSYMATREEKHTTRARANILRPGPHQHPRGGAAHRATARRPRRSVPDASRRLGDRAARLSR